VSGLTDVSSVAAGCTVWWESCHSLALKRDGTVWAWGDNDSGQLGDETTTGRMTPLQIGGLSDVVAIAARNFANAHDVAVKSDGTVWEWPAAGRSTPAQVAGLSGIVAVAEGFAHTLALRRDGTVWAWGSNSSGQLGVETIVTRTTPAQVVAPAP
jgi:alpha-tubulin suppressor-like RCC1 family protein